MRLSSCRWKKIKVPSLTPTREKSKPTGGGRDVEKE